jgi:hypothetical protein
MDGGWKGITRRDFLRGSAAFTVAGMVGGAGTGSLVREAAAQDRARVVLVRDPNVLDGAGKLNGDVLGRMLDQAVVASLGESDPATAWKRLVRPSDTVGIKTNSWNYLRTPPALEAAIKRRVMEAGVPEGRIGIDDRGVLANPIFQKSTALINVRPFRTHYWSGVGGLLKNYIMFSESPSSWHDDSCASLAGLWDLPMVKGKTRLNVLVMLTPLFHGKGPHHFHKDYIWEYKGLLVGTDPVAVDATGLRVLEAKRRAHFGEDLALPVSPKHIRVAQEKYRLGVADPSRIEVVRLGWMEGALI